MTDQYLYLDETGTLDFENRAGERYFGVGTAHFSGEHGDALWDGFRLRVELESRGVQVPNGLHAKNDSARTRSEVYAQIAAQAPRFDVTMLCKAKAYPGIKAAGKVRLYKLACWLHLKHVVPSVSDPGDRVFVVVGRLTTSSRRDAIRHAVGDVCDQLGHDRTVTPCIWEAPSSWGIQVADCALWSVQRRAEGKAVAAYTAQISRLIATEFYPWGKT